MFAYELPLDPPCDYWETYRKPEFIKEKIQEMCENILKKGENTSFQDIYDMMYIHIEQNFLENSYDCGM